MHAAEAPTFEGGCACRRVRYRLRSRPLSVHGCHGRGCRRETGSAFVHVGTPDAPDAMPPDIHTIAASRPPWAMLPPGTPTVPGFYDARDRRPPESLARRHAPKAAAGSAGA